MMVQNAVHSEKTVRATPNWPRSRFTTLRPGRARETTMRAAPAMPAMWMLITRPRLSHALAFSQGNPAWHS